MIYKKISSKKSKTIGVSSSDGRTRFKKVDFFAEVELEETDNPIEARQQLSKYIDDYLIEEANKK
jgi:hypothetical protein